MEDSPEIPIPTTVPFEWRGQPIGIKLVARSNAVSLEIRCRDGPQSTNLNLNEVWVRRVRCAASLVLELDAALARSVHEGGVARLDVRHPRPKPPARPRSVDEAVIQRPRIEELVAPLLFPSTAKVALRPFQEVGVKWLVERRVGILADDMGLGKTAQALRAITELIEQGAVRCVLVVCPKSLVANWETECGKWAPALTVVRVAPSNDQSDAVWSAVLGRSHIIVTSYEQLRPPPRALVSGQIDLIVADEAHRLRKSQAKLVKAFREITAKRVWALTGTPIERDAVDLATLLSLLEPTRFSTKSAVAESVGLRSLARPYLLRRLKKDVLGELPPVIDKKEVVELTSKQYQAYASVCSRQAGGGDYDILKRLTLMRSICDADPATGASAKLDRVVEILESIRRLNEKAVVFSYLLQPLNVLAQRLARVSPTIRAVSLTGQSSVAEREQVLHEFKTDEGVIALLCSSRVGGEGLTLTEANHVMFINEWWNPSTNAQSRDRVVRIGQRRVVHVHRFRCRQTIEEVLDDILSRKTETFASIVDALASGNDLTPSESKKLFAEAVRRFDD